MRWSAAKGIGRLTTRLPKEMAYDIIGALLDQFETEVDEDNFWHGGCLALAELARRGVLLPSHLDRVIPIVVKAMNFDVIRGYHSVGAHVRDAACYVCWAFARAYPPSVMMKFTIGLDDDVKKDVPLLSMTMLATSLFDREVNCRRAASAAFQENVGRQGNINFPRGLDIMAIADYFSLGNRKSSYLKLAPVIAAMSPKIHEHLWIHLLSTKIHSWDEDIRTLAASAIGRLVIIAADNENLKSMILNDLDNVLLSNCLNPADALKRHGSILAVAEILLALSQVNVIVDTPILTKIVNVVPELLRQRLYRGKGGEYLRIASCYLIECIARCHVSMSHVTGSVVAGKKMMIALVDSLTENLRQPHEKIQQAAQSALRHFLYTYFGKINDKDREKIESATTRKYLTSLQKDDNVAVTRGFALALGVLPRSLLVSEGLQVENVIEALDDMSRVDRKIAGEADPETRRNALLAITEIAERLDLSERNFNSCWKILHRGCQDYSTDKRGDTGSWSRATSLQGMERLLRKQIILKQCHSNSVVAAQGLGILAHGAVDKALTWSQVVFPCLSLMATEAYLVHPSGVELVTVRNSLMDAWEVRLEISLLHSTESLIESLLTQSLKQLAEKLDSVRDCAGQLIERLVFADYHDQSLFAGKDELRVCLLSAREKQKVSFLKPEASRAAEGDEEDGNEAEKVKDDDEVVSQVQLSWSKPNVVFPFLRDCMSVLSTTFLPSILAGLVTSIGGLSGDTAREAQAALIQYHQIICKSSSLHRFLVDTMLEILVKNHAQRNERVIPAALKSAEFCLRHEIFYKRSKNDYLVALKLERLVVRESQVSTVLSKIRTSVDILSILLSWHGRVRWIALETLVLLLGHKFPKIRTCS